MFFLLLVPITAIPQVQSDTSIIGCGEFSVRSYDSIQGTGSMTDFYGPGKISSCYTFHWPYSDAKDSAKAFHRNGNPAECNYQKNGSMSGPYTTFYENGQVKTKGQAYNGFAAGIWEEFYADGKLRSHREFTLTRADSVFDGKDSVHKKLRQVLFRDTTEYGRMSNNDTILFPECKDSHITSVHAFIVPEKTGVWSFYNEKGKLIRREKHPRKKTP